MRKKNSCGSKIPLPPITFLMVRPLDHIYSFNKLAANIIFSESTGACVLNFALSSLHEISFEPVNHRWAIKSLPY